MAKNVEAHGGRWRYRFQFRGRKYVVSTGLAATPRNKAAAVRAMEEHRKRLLLGEQEPTEAVTFNEAVESFNAWKEGEHRSKPETARRAAISLRNWSKRLGEKPMSAVSIADVQDFMTWRRAAQKVAEVTLRKDLFALKLLVRFCRQRGWISADPTEGVPIPSDRDSRNEVVLTPEEEQAYLAVCEPDLKDLAALMLNQGMRPSEVLALRSEHVEGRTVRIVDGKSRAARRTLWLTDEVLSILLSRSVGRSWLWPNPHRKGPLPYKQVLRAHYRAVKAAGLRFDIYSLRHTFATRFYDRTKDLIALKDILGHGDLRTVLRYVNDNQARAFEAMRIFSGQLVGNSRPGESSFSGPGQVETGRDDEAVRRAKS